MKRSRISKVTTRLWVIVLLLGPVMPSLQAEVECSNADLNGAYSFGGTGLEVAPEAMPPAVPEPGAFPTTFVGSFTADGAGKITTFKVAQNANLPPEVVGFLFFERDPIAEGVVPHIDYTVASDCSGTMSWLDLSQFGPAPTTLRFVLANGGREGFAIRPAPPSTVLLNFKRADKFDERLERKVDAIMRRLGIPPTP